jgi:hypothetical protein
MLSPDLDHQDVPQDFEENLQFRIRILDAAESDRNLQAGIKDLCRTDLFFYINAFVWQYNPDKTGWEVEPFICWDFQKDAFRKLLDSIECHCSEKKGVHKHDLLWEKSREMGASWMFLIAADWLCRFHGDKQILMISRSADAVDSKSKNSLFAKLRFIHKHLPDWLKGNVTDQSMYLGYENTGSEIVGEASTGRSGVGGRASVMFIDEFSQIREDYEVLHRTSNTSGARVFNGTHVGQGTAFFELSKRLDMRKIRMHWTKHPAKSQGMYELVKGKVKVADPKFQYPEEFRFVMDGSPLGGYAPGIRSPYYDDECRRKGSPRAVAMDLDIDPEGSESLFFDRPLIHRLKQSCGPPLWEGDLDYDQQTGKFRALNQRSGGIVKLWVLLDVGGLPPRDLYGAGCDLSTGSGYSNSCLSIISGTTGLKVCEVADPYLDQYVFAAFVFAMCSIFRNQDGEGPLIAWEKQGPGGLFGRRLLDMGYRRVFMDTNEFKVFSQKTDHPGFNAQNKANKRLMLEEYAVALRLGYCMNKSAAALDECLNFRYDVHGDVEFGGTTLGKDPSGAAKNHGDRVIADSLGWKMVKDQVQKRDLPAEKKEPDASSMAYRRRLHAQQREQTAAWA